MDLLSREEFIHRIRETHKDKHVSHPSYYTPTVTLPKELKHNTFDGGEYKETYMSNIKYSCSSVLNN